MVRILTGNSHTTFKSIFESIEGENKIDFYTMPLVQIPVILTTQFQFKVST